MIEWEQMMELCGRELDQAPESRCNEIRADGFGFCVLDVRHTGPHAYETYSPELKPLTEPLIFFLKRFLKHLS